jgi:hypothetical protein
VAALGVLAAYDEAEALLLIEGGREAEGEGEDEDEGEGEGEGGGEIEAERQAEAEGEGESEGDVEAECKAEGDADGGGGGGGGGGGVALVVFDELVERWEAPLPMRLLRALHDPPCDGRTRDTMEVLEEVRQLRAGAARAYAALGLRVSGTDTAVAA